MQAQQFINKPEIIFINDSSTDDTADKLQEAKDGGAQIKVINAPELPNQWIGKPWALQQGYLQAKGEIVVTLDADVRLTSTAIAQAIAMLGERSFISPYPRQIAKTFSERLIQPLLQWSWMSTVPLRIAEKSRRTSLAVANGQFFLVRKSALDQIGGFTAIAAEVLDDMELARALIKSGAGNYNSMCIGCHLAPGIAQTELSQALYPAPPNLAKEGIDGNPPDLSAASDLHLKPPRVVLGH